MRRDLGLSVHRFVLPDTSYVSRASSFGWSDDRTLAPLSLLATLRSGQASFARSCTRSSCACPRAVTSTVRRNSAWKEESSGSCPLIMPFGTLPKAAGAVSGCMRTRCHTTKASRRQVRVILPASRHRDTVRGRVSGGKVAVPGPCSGRLEVCSRPRAWESTKRRPRSHPIQSRNG